VPTAGAADPLFTNRAFLFYSLSLVTFATKSARTGGSRQCGKMPAIEV
jgi:hypothetical protein